MGTAERLKGVRKKRKAFVVRRLLVVLMLTVLLIAAYLFINSSYFGIGAVQVEGNKYMTTEEILTVAGIPVKTNLFRLNTADVKERLTNDLRIASVEISRQLPATVVLKVKERRPYAYAATNYGFVELDQQGMVLAASKTIKTMNVPMITGIKLGNVYVGDQLDNPALKETLAFLSLLSEDSLNELSEINISNPDEIWALTLHSIRLRFGSQEELRGKAPLTNQILSELGDQRNLVELIDLRYATPYIKFKK